MTSATDPKTIILTGEGIQQESEAGGTITPGHLIERSGANEVVVHATGGGTANLHFAIEYALTGRSISDNYSGGDNVLFVTVSPGQHVYALLEDGQDVSAGNFLTSNGGGTLKAAASGDIVVAQALEALAPSGSDGRIVVEAVTPQTFPA